MPAELPRWLGESKGPSAASAFCFRFLHQIQIRAPRMTPTAMMTPTAIPTAAPVGKPPDEPLAPLESVLAGVGVMVTVFTVPPAVKVCTLALGVWRRKIGQQSCFPFNGVTVENPELALRITTRESVSYWCHRSSVHSG